jgi:microcystin degradation protein MlrC
MSKKILIGEFKHETNSFSPFPTNMKSFRDRHIFEGNEIIDYFEGTKVEIGGFIDVAKRENFKLIPTIAANAMPAGKVTLDVYNYVKNSILDGIRQNKDIKGVLLALHGAMVLEDSQDGEGDLLEAIRLEVGSYIPIIVSLDLHVNLTEKMMKNATAFFPFDTYPHVDMYETGVRAAQCMVDTLRKKQKPIMSHRKLPILSPSLETSIEPCKSFSIMTKEWEKQDGVISVSVSYGFPWSDVEGCGISVTAVTNNNKEQADIIVEDIEKKLLARYKEFIKVFETPETAIEKALMFDGKPVVFAEVSDNPGGGGPEDGTHLLRKMIEMKVENAGVAFICDPEAVDKAIQAGVTSKVKISLGAKSTSIVGQPIECEAVVKTITDGIYRNEGFVEHGVINNIGRTVVLGIDGIDVIVAEKRIQPYCPSIFRRMGLEPSKMKIVVVKSSLHFKASYDPISPLIIFVDTPGIMSPALINYEFKNVKRPIFPLDELEI